MMLYNFLLIFLLFSCQEKSKLTVKEAKTSSSIPKRAITKVIVKAVHFDITTFVNIDCDTFTRQFPDAATTQIVDKDVLAELSRHMAHFKEDKIKYPLDTRAKIFIYFNDRSCDTICMSKFRMVLNGKPIQYDKSLSSLLQINTD